MMKDIPANGNFFRQSLPISTICPFQTIKRDSRDFAGFFLTCLDTNRDTRGDSSMVKYVSATLWLND